MNDYLRIDELDETVARLCAGDDEARTTLIQLSHDRLHRLAKKMLGDFPSVRRWEETDDIFQRVTLRLWEALKTVQPQNTRHFFNLAALQVRRELLSLARSLNGPLGLHRNQDSVDPSASLRPTGEASDTWEAIRLTTWTDFHESVGQLDDEERETFELIWYQGLSQQTTAELLGVSQKTVSRRWQTGRRKIFELLGGQLPG